MFGCGVYSFPPGERVRCGCVPQEVEEGSRGGRQETSDLDDNVPRGRSPGNVPDKGVDLSRRTSLAVPNTGVE